MKLIKDLNDFNKRFADELLPFFPEGIDAYQTEEEMLCFRGKIPNSDDPNHIGSHVVAELDQEVKAALKNASPTERDEMTKHLISNLGTQVKCQYDKDNIGQLALSVVGNMRMITGK